MPKKAKKPEPKKSPKKRAQSYTISNERRDKLVLRILVYWFFALLVLILSVLVFYRARGYTFTKDGDIVKRGLVLVDSRPLASLASIDDKELEKTETKAELEEGSHTLSLSADGYRTWQKTFNIKSEEVLWYYYPYLIPDKLTSTQVLTNQPQSFYSDLNGEGEVLAIPRGVNKAGQQFSVNLLKLKEREPQKVIEQVQFSADLFSSNPDGSYGDFEFQAWSRDSKSIVVKHTFSTGVELVNLRLGSTSESQNITRALAPGGVVLSTSFDPKSRVYVLQNGNLNLLNPKDLSLNRAIDTGVQNFQSFDNGTTAIYSKVSSPAEHDSATVDIYLQSGSEQPLKFSSVQVPLDQISALNFSYINNRRSNYAVVLNPSLKELLIYKNPLDAKDPKDISPYYLATFAELKSSQINYSRSQSVQPGAFISLQEGPDRIFTYDFERELASSYQLKSSSTADALVTAPALDLTHISWVDSHRMQARSSDGKVYLFDHDGNYLNQISTSSTSSGYFINDRSHAYFINLNPQTQTDDLSLVKFKE